MKGNEIREQYLSFFESKGHLRLPSYSLIPQNDPSLLLIGAGMAPLKPYFTGKVEPPRHRLTTSQKCIRTGDIENVGRTARHHTFFEMLGNFSFGDYFKKEAITWAWEFLTDVLQLEKEKLYVTVYPEDQEAHDYWHKLIGIPEDHIYPLSDNFWEIGEGPCGPDSEIFYDQGEEFGTDPENQMGGDGDRFLEIWNLVFTQFDRQKDGSYLPLVKKNIDTGAGLERVAAVMQHKKNNFESDLFFPIIERAAGLAHTAYGKDAASDVSLKVISDHARALANLIGDGVLPSNEGRGYVLRRILRRAVRHGKLLGIEGPFIGQMIDEVVDMMKPAYPELLEKQDFIRKIAGTEEARFQTTLNAGTDLLSEMIEDLRKKKQTALPGEDVFKLYDTYGFPWELTEEIAGEAGLSIDAKGFEAAMEEQKERARAAAAGNKVYMKMALPDTTKLDASALTETDADGMTEVVLLGKDGKSVETAADGDKVALVLGNNPFHAEGGGQIGDTGVLKGAAGILDVEDCRKQADGISYVLATVREGTVAAGETVAAVVDRERREALARNHTGTHLLQAALKKVLGNTVNQAGSLVLPDRLRFDFTWPEAVTAGELAEVEALVNEEVRKGTALSFREMPVEEAKKLGAMALFGEKYGDVVRVVTIGDFSMELCGGSHVKNTGEIGLFRIVSEGGIGSGVRRIEAITGKAAYEASVRDRAALREAAGLLKGKPEELMEKLNRTLAALKAAEAETARLKQQATRGQLDDLLKHQKEKNGIPYFGAVLQAGSMDELRRAADLVKAKVPDAAFILGAAADGKVSLVGMAGDAAVKAGVHMGKAVSAAAKTAGGGGGGKPAMAQAGGKDPSRLNEAVEAGVQAIEAMLG